MIRMAVDTDGRRVTVGRTFTFDAAHHLPDHPGECKRPHGHTYRVDVEVQGFVHEETGMVVDFGTLKSLVTKVLWAFDHYDLNDVVEGPTTAERLVVLLWRLLQTTLEGPYPLAVLSRVRLYEGEGKWAEVSR